MKFPHNISRLEALSDGVFAFAATLLVVSLGLDESWLAKDSRVLELITFGGSFFVLIALWAVHYNYFRRAAYVDYWIIAYNTVLLFVVLYYVFPLKSLINTWLGQEPISVEGLASLFSWYGLGFLLIFLCFSLMYRRAYKKTKSMSRSLVLLFYSRHFAIYVGVAALSIGVATLGIGIRFGLPGILYVLLGPFCYWHSVQFEKTYPNSLQ
ncbi:MAG: TMEM175 family protein [Robiginitalea sp.]